MTPKVVSFGLPVAIGVILLWLMKPGGGSFMPVPVPKDPAPDWVMADLDGGEVRSDRFAGKVVVLNFWATWCPPCVREIPDLEAFHQRRQADGVVVVGASVDAGGTDAVRRFAERHKITYPVLMAGPEVQERFGGIASIPTTFVIGRDGRFAARYLGALTAAELERAVAPLLGAPAAAGPPPEPAQPR